MPAKVKLWGSKTKGCRQLKGRGWVLWRQKCSRMIDLQSTGPNTEAAVTGTHLKNKRCTKSGWPECPVHAREGHVTGQQVEAGQGTGS